MTKACLFDTHAHLTDKAFDNDRDLVVNQALNNSVQYILCVGYDLASSQQSIELSTRYPDIYAAVGVHPHDADSWTSSHIEELKALARNPKVKAIGETGLDFYRNYSKPENQHRAFTDQLRLAKALNLPVVIHIRNAHAEALEILKAENYYRGVLHCFSGNQTFARQALDLGFFLSFAGSITFNGAKLKEIVKTAPIDRLLAETDCPYLAPHPERGKRNEPRFVGLVVEEMARAHSIPGAELAAITCENGKRCFRIE